jgi:hypothetical protein
MSAKASADYRRKYRERVLLTDRLRKRVKRGSAPWESGMPGRPPNELDRVLREVDAAIEQLRPILLRAARHKKKTP